MCKKVDPSSNPWLIKMKEQTTFRLTANITVYGIKIRGIPNRAIEYMYKLGMHHYTLYVFDAVAMLMVCMVRGNGY